MTESWAGKVVVRQTPVKQPVGMLSPVRWRTGRSHSRARALSRSPAGTHWNLMYLTENAVSS